MRLVATLAMLVCLTGAALAQAPPAGTPLGGVVLTDGSLDLSGSVVSVAPEGPRLADPGDYTDIGRGATGIPLNGFVYAVVVAPDGTVYASGNFSLEGDPRADRVARWDGTEWVTLGTDLRVYALAVAPDGSVYAGGAFAMAGGTPASNVARWTGTEWQPLAEGVNGNVGELAVGPDGALYASGYFTTAGTAPATHIARWDGTSWSPMPNGPARPPSALAFGPDGALYVAGPFATGGGEPVDRVARWAGTEWVFLGTAFNKLIKGLSVAPDGSLYVGGYFTTAGGVPANRVARWTGTEWQALGQGVSGSGGASVDALTVAPDGVLYAAGEFTAAGGEPANHVAQWDGAAWQPLGGGVGGDYEANVYTLALAPDGSLIVGGGFRTAGAMPAIGFARWTGTEWRGTTSRLNSQVLALASAPDGSVYAGGYFNTDGGGPGNHVARWTGTDWEPLGSGMNGVVLALAVAHDGTVYAAGRFTTAGGAPANRIARWDGTAWHPLGTGMTGEVAALSVGLDGTVYAGGSFQIVGGVQANLGQWDGTAWRAVGGGFYVVTALASARDGSLYVGVRHPYGVYRWNGTVYRALDTYGLSGSVRAITVGPDGSVYVGGDFEYASSTPLPVNNVVRWTGTAFERLGDGVGGSVAALAVAPDGTLYVGGPFTSAGGVPALRAAQWTGTEWRPLGAGLNGDAYALAFDAEENLILGGSFTVAGGVDSPFITRYETLGVVSTEPSAVGQALTLSVGPNPTSGSATAWLSLGEALRAEVSVYDLLGRRVWRQEGPLGAGPQTVALDASAWAPGLYVVRVEAGGSVASARLIVAR